MNIAAQGAAAGSAGAAASERLTLHNASRSPVRVRLWCGGHVVWDTWLTPRGALQAPAFPPAALRLSAWVEDAAQGVRRQACSEDSGPGSSWRLQWRPLLGQPLLDWSAEPAGAQPPGVHNGTGRDCELELLWPRSPYRLRSVLRGDGFMPLAFPAPMLCAVHDGKTVHQPIAGHGHWTFQVHARQPAWVPGRPAPGRD